MKIEPVEAGGRIYRLVAPGIGMLPGTNCWLIREDDGLTMVDTGLPSAARALVPMLSELRHRLGPLKRIIVTHAHIDHAGALSALVDASGASAMAGAGDAAYLTGERSVASMPAHFLCSFILKASRIFGMCDPRPVREVQILGDGERVGGLTVLLTPGHTPGSLSLWDEISGALITGDTMVYQNGRLVLGVCHFTANVTQATPPPAATSPTPPATSSAATTTSSPATSRPRSETTGLLTFIDACHGVRETPGVVPVCGLDACKNGITVPARPSPYERRSW